MAKNLLNPLEDPPSASSSEDDSVEVSSKEGEEQISGSSSEESKPKDPSTKPRKTTPSTASKQKSDSDSGSEDDSDSEAEPFPEATAVSAVNKSNPVVKSGKKRAGEGTSTEVSAKKAKNVSASGRVWNEDDEISLLQGMIDYKAETGKSPYDDMNGFFELVKKDISFEVSKVQFGDKIRGLKKKYIDKPKSVFTKAHDKNCLRLAKHIWGSDGLAKKKVDSVVESAVVKSPVHSKKKVDSMVGSSGVKSPKKKNEKKKMDSGVEEDMLGSNGIVLESAKSNGKVSNAENVVEEDKEVLIRGGGSQSPTWFEKSFLFESIRSFGVDEDYVMQRWSKVPVEAKKRIHEKLKLVHDKEFELFTVKADVMSDTSSAISKAI